MQHINGQLHLPDLLNFNWEAWDVRPGWCANNVFGIPLSMFQPPSKSARWRWVCDWDACPFITLVAKEWRVHIPTDAQYCQFICRLPSTQSAAGVLPPQSLGFPAALNTTSMMSYSQSTAVTSTPSDKRAGSLIGIPWDGMWARKHSKLATAAFKRVIRGYLIVVRGYQEEIRGYHPLHKLGDSTCCILEEGLGVSYCK